MYRNIAENRLCKDDFQKKGFIAAQQEFSVSYE